MRDLFARLVALSICVPASAMADAPRACVEDPNGSACINECYARPENTSCVDFCDNAATPASVPWCQSLCRDTNVSAHPFCSCSEAEGFLPPQYFFQFVGEVAARIYQEADITLVAIPTFGVRVTSSLSVIGRGWLGPIGVGAHSAATYSTELGGGLGVDVHFFDVIQLSHQTISALDLSLVAGPWMAPCNDRVCTWTPVLFSAQVGFSPSLIRNAAVASYSGMTFGIEGGGGYDYQAQHGIARLGMYVGVELAAK